MGGSKWGPPIQRTGVCTDFLSNLGPCPSTHFASNRDRPQKVNPSAQKWSAQKVIEVQKQSQEKLDEQSTQIHAKKPLTFI